MKINWDDIWYWLAVTGMMVGVAILLVLGVALLLAVIASPFVGIGALMWWFKELFLL